jgi:hypothetical protein
VRSASGLDLIMDSLLGDFFDVGYTNLAATGRVVRVWALRPCARAPQRGRVTMARYG